MKTKFLVFICFIFFSACNAGKSTNVDCPNNLVVKTERGSVIIAKSSDADYKLFQDIFKNSSVSEDINWGKVRLRLAELDNSSMASQLLVMIDDDIIAAEAGVWVECCRGCRVLLPHDCSGCDAICNPKSQPIRDKIEYNEK